MPSPLSRRPKEFIMRNLIAAALLGFALLLSPLTPSAQADARSLVDSYSASDLRYMLEEANIFDEVSTKSANQVLVKKDGRSVLLIIYGDGDLGIYYGARGTIPLQAINEWNKTKRLSRAYLDNDNDVALEAELLSNGGMNEEKVVSFVKFFFQSVGQYVDFVQKNM